MRQHETRGEMHSRMRQFADQADVDAATIDRLRAQGALDQDQIDLDAATIATLEAEGIANRAQIEHLTTALAAARQIGAAIGILMARHHVTQEQAFAALSRVSQDSNVKVRDLALKVTRDGTLPGR